MSQEEGFPRLRRGLLVAVMALLALWAGSANAQFQIKSPDGNASIKFGLLLQGWADWTQDAASGGYAQNLFLRRARFILGGQIAPNVTFFMETDNPNLGKTPKSLGTGLIVQDAFMEWKPADQFALDAGLILIPMCRNCLQAATTLVSMDYGSFSFLNSAPTQSSVGRDTGFQAKGYLANKRLEYRFGVFQGIRQAGSRNGFRTAGRLQYSFLDVEVGPFYTGTYLGKKKIFEIGVGMDEQQDYRATSGDFFFDHPLAVRLHPLRRRQDLCHAPEAERLLCRVRLLHPFREGHAVPEVRDPELFGRGERVEGPDQVSGWIRVLPQRVQLQHQGRLHQDRAQGRDEDEPVHDPVPALLLLTLLRGTRDVARRERPAPQFG
jgi:hypothetical protein